MTIFEHTKEHDLDCQCSFCGDVDPTKSIARELEKCIEELIEFYRDSPLSQVMTD